MSRRFQQMPFPFRHVKPSGEAVIIRPLFVAERHVSYAVGNCNASPVLVAYETFSRFFDWRSDPTVAI